MSKHAHITTAQTQELVKDYLKKEFINNVRLNDYIPLEIFVKDDLIYGKGIRNINRGFITPTDFSNTNPARVPNPNVPSLYTQDLTDQLKLVFTNTVAKYSHLDSFANADELERFIEQLTSRLQASANLNMQQLIGYIFSENIPTELLTLTTEQKTQADKIKAKFTYTDKLIVDPNDANAVEYIIRKQAYELTRYKVNNSFNKTVPAACPISEQVLVISNDLYLSILQAKKLHFNPTDLFKEFYKVIVLDIPKEKIVFLDKEALRLYPRINEVLTQEYNARLEVDYYLHF